MERTYEPVADSDAEVVGLIAYSILAAMTRLAKDSDQAPTFEAKVEHARMATRVFETFTQVETWCTHRGMDLSTYARAYDGLYDDLDARTRPKTWHERSIKTYVTLGVLGGFLREIASRKNLFPGANWDLSRPTSSLRRGCPCGRAELPEKFWVWCVRRCLCTRTYRCHPKTQTPLLKC